MRAYLLVLLAACGGTSDPEVDAILALTGDAEAGEAVFATTCALSTCHGDGGAGGGSGVDLSAHIPHHSDWELANFIVNGVDDMPPVGLEAQEGADVIAYLRTQWPED